MFLPEGNVDCKLILDLLHFTSFLSFSLLLFLVIPTILLFICFCFSPF